MTKQLQTDKIDGTVVNEQLVILRGQSGVTIDACDAKNIIGLIEDTLPGNYSILVDRVNDYSISPVAVYAYLNNLSRLNAIALVVYRTISASVTEIETTLSTKPIKVFNNIDAARHWLAAYVDVAAEDEPAS